MNKKGFTLIELMVVIVIMGVLAAVAIPRMFGNVEKARLSGLAESFAQYEKSVVNYYILTGKVPTSADQLDFDMGNGNGQLADDGNTYTWSEGHFQAVIGGGGSCDGLEAAIYVFEDATTGKLSSRQAGTALDDTKCAAKIPTIVVKTSSPIL